MSEIKKQESVYNMNGISAADLMKREFPEPKWAIPKILPEGLNILGGKPKMGKSIICLNLGLAIASGGKAFGSIDVEQGTVIYFALEDTARRLQKRIKQMLVDDEVAPEKLILFNECPRMKEGGLEE
jgi:RecA-family ATPase